MDLQTFRLDRIRTAAARAGVSAVVASSTANIQYLSGFRDLFQELTSGNQSYVLYDVDRNRLLYVMGVAYIPSILEQDAAAEIITAGGFSFGYTEGDALSARVEAIRGGRYDSLEEALAAAIATVNGTVALDESNIDFQCYGRIV